MTDEVTNQASQAPVAAALEFENASDGFPIDPKAVSQSAPLADLSNPNVSGFHERASALVAGYEHAMETNSPRTMTELNELKALLLG